VRILLPAHSAQLADCLSPAQHSYCCVEKK